MIKHSLRFVIFTFIFGTTLTNSFSQINLTATAGTPAGSFVNLSDAFAAINAGTHQGVITIDVTGNTTEPALPTALLASGVGSSTYTSVYIKPTVTASITGTPASGGQGVIMMDGADNVTIDGSISVGGTTRDLTIQNTALTSQTNNTAIRLIGNTTGGLGATNIQIRNCIIIGNTPGNSGTSGSTVTTSYGIYAGSTTATSLSSSGTGSNYDNITIENNEIKSAYFGIYIACTSTNPGDNIQILNNTIGSSNPLEQVSFEGITLTGMVGGTVRQNEISNLKVTTNVQVKGIDVGGTGSSNIQITRNHIHGLYSEGTTTTGVYGISISGGANHLVDNNIIYDLKSPNYNNTSMTYQVHGIRLSSGSGHKVYYNSVHLYGDVSTGTAVLARSTCFSVTATGVTSLDVRNNIFANKMTTSLAPTNTEFLAVWIAASYNFANLTLNNNAYLVNNDAEHFVGKLGINTGSGNTQLLDDWKLITQVGNPTNDNNSVPLGLNSNAPFTADNDLTIPNGTTTFLESGGIVITPQLPVPNIDYTGVNRPAGTGTAPDIGAYEFEGMQISLDIAVVDLLLPSTTGCHGSADTVRISIQNATSNPIDFAVDNLTVNGYTTGANPTVFPPVVINTGTLAGNATMNVLITSNYDMSILGTHNFHANASITGDNANLNDTLDSVSIVISGGIATAVSSEVCFGSPASLSAIGFTNGGTIQWQESNDAVIWNDIMGATTISINPSPTDTMYYRFISCGLHTSIIDTINIISLDPPIANDVSRCGAGQLVLSASASGPGHINWYSDPGGANLLDTGSTFTTPIITSTTTYYAASATGIGIANVGLPAEIAGTSGAGTTNYGLVFDALANFTLQTVVIYPISSTAGTVSTVTIDVVNGSGTILHTATVGVIGNPVASATPQTVTLNFNITPGTNLKLRPGSFGPGISGLLFEPSASAPPGGNYGYPFAVPGILSINHSTLTAPPTNTPRLDLYYYFYNWNITSGCVSDLVPVNAIVTPSDTIIATAVTNPICNNTSTVINVNSTNPGYQYTWTPATGLSSTTGSSVTTNSDTSLTYTITAIDTASDCASLTNISITVLPAPTVNITTPDTALCLNSNLELNAEFTSHITSNGDIGLGTSSNSATSTTILGPYGGLYGGTKNQYLLTAADLTGAGITAGFINQLAFDVANLNSVPVLSDFTIKIDTTSLNVLTVGYAPCNNIVFYDPAYMPVLGWNNHNFSSNFLWNGTSNLIVEVCFNNNNAGTASGNASVRYTNTTGVNTVNYYRADNDPNVCAMLSGTPSVNRPNIRLSTASTVSFQWTPTANLSNATIINPVLTGISTNTYTLEVTDDVNGCSETDDITVTINPLPLFNIGNDTLVCENLALTPFAVFASDNTLNYLWFDGAITTGTLINSTGTFWATGTNPAGCSSTDSMTVGTIAPANVDINIDVTGTNTADLDAGAGYSSYLWSNAATTQTTTVIGNGTYFVQVTDANGCPNADTVSIVFSLGIDENDNSQLSFYPNPSTGIINMAGTGLNGKPLKVEIMSISGQMVYQQNIEEPGENFIQQIDLSAVAEGTYVVRVINDQRSYTSRIVIVRN